MTDARTLDRTLQRPLRQASIAVLCDSPGGPTSVASLLRGAGFGAVTVRTDVSGFLDHALTEEPDLVVVDGDFADVGGLALVRVLTRLLGLDRYVPALVVVPGDEPDARERALAAGARDCLSSPVRGGELVLRVRNLLDSVALHRGMETLLRDRTADLEASRMETLARLALAAESRDDITHRHTLRVGRNARLLGEALGMDADDAASLERAAPLHDVGKIGVPDSVLLKPGPLTPDEFAIVQDHTVIGGRILGSSSLPVLRLAERIALEHHERWDGGGYPRGLARTQICLEARIVSVVDVFDALIHERPYKPAWPVEAAVAELRSLRGRHFDPEVLDVFVDGVGAGRWG